MKAGCYHCVDERVGDLVKAYCTWLVFAERPANWVGVAMKNTIGNGGVLLPYLIRDPDFLDDEDTGRVILPTPEGLVRLQWPGAALFDEMGLGYSGWPHELASAPDADRQAYLFGLCCGDGML